MKRLLLVDLSAVFYRAWHATADQELGNAFDSTVKKVRWLASSGYDGVAVCVDTPPYDRKALSPEYKANREKPDPALTDQLRRVKERLVQDGFPLWGVTGAEADDIVASATLWATNAGHTVHVASADKDLLALVSERVYFRNTSTDDIFDVGKVAEKFKVQPWQMPSYLALVGDKSDNVKGVAGVGAVKAAELVNAYESVPQLLAALRAGSIVGTPAINAALHAAKADGSLDLAFQLVTLRSDIDRIDWSEAFKPREEKPLSETTDAEFEDVAGAKEPEPQEPSNAAQESPAEQAPPKTMALAVVSPGYSTALEPRTFNEAWVMAKVAVNSRAFGVANNETALAMIMKGRAMGLDAVTSLTAFHVIKNKLAQQATIIEGMVMRAECCEYFYCVESTAQSSTWATKRRGNPGEQRHTWTIDDAAQLGLTSNDQWKKQPRTMLRHRCGTDFARMVYPDVVAGLYSDDELEQA